MAKRKNKINSIVAPLTPKRMNREIGAETRLKFGELGRDLQGDLRASKQDIRNTNSWFAQYQNRMNPVRDEQTAGTANLQDEMRKNASYLSGWNQNQSQTTGAAEDRSAAIRGAVADPTAASRDEAADTQRQALLASSRDRAAQIGESTGGYLRGVTAASELGRQADVRSIRNTIAETRSKQRDLSRERGDFRVARAGEKRGEERQWRNENRTFAAGREDAANANALDWASENRLARGAANSGSGSSGSGGSGGGKGGVSRKSVSRGIGLLDGKYNPTGGSGQGSGGQYDGYTAFNYLKKNRGEAINYLVRAGVSRPAARAAVRRYIRKWDRKIGSAANSSGAGRPGSNTG